MLRVPVPELLTSQARALLRHTTRAMQKVKEAEPARVKSKGKGKAEVVNEVLEEAQREKLEKLKAERVVIQDLIDQLES
jgi:predicted transcriptional regulator